MRNDKLAGHLEAMNQLYGVFNTLSLNQACGLKHERFIRTYAQVISEILDVSVWRWWWIGEIHDVGHHHGRDPGTQAELIILSSIEHRMVQIR